MPVDPNADIEITAFAWVPPFAEGLVRDLRARWALEEVGLPYRVRLLHGERPPEYYLEQPFGQVPCYAEGPLKIFESGAIVQHIGEKSERLLPRDAVPRMRAIQWTYAALNSVEPAIQNLALIDLFYSNEEWAKLRRPGAEEFVRQRLKCVADWLGGKEWLEDHFTIGDLIMATVLRIPRNTGLVAEHSNLAAYLARAEQRPAFQRALADQIAVFKQHQPEGATA
ncbi:MAG TPA: glutathione S-transferase family protein [Sphingomicrobium sp.]|nr:glutathione S-transferase family protein [Sphingomicrobium sp.]